MEVNIDIRKIWKTIKMKVKIKKVSKWQPKIKL